MLLHCEFTHIDAHWTKGVLGLQVVLAIVESSNESQQSNLCCRLHYLDTYTAMLTCASAEGTRVTRMEWSMFLIVSADVNADKRVPAGSQASGLCFWAQQPIPTCCTLQGLSTLLLASCTQWSQQPTKHVQLVVLQQILAALQHICARRPVPSSGYKFTHQENSHLTASCTTQGQVHLGTLNVHTYNSVEDVTRWGQ